MGEVMNTILLAKAYLIFAPKCTSEVETNTIKMKC